jgi:hypothetical protein
MKKVVRNGKVAVLVSAGWGAGFLSWGAPVEAIFDPMLVDMIENDKIQDAIQYVEKTYPDACSGGVSDLYIEWIPEGAKFIINEYDGSESIQLLDDTNWLTA